MKSFKEIWNYRFFGSIYSMVSVTSLWTNILSRNRELALWLRKVIVPCTSRLYFRTTVVMDDSCLMYQHTDVEEIEEQLNNDFENVCDWFVDNNLSIHFGEDKTKSILFTTKRKIRSARKLNVKYKNIKIKQHLQVLHLGCVLDELCLGNLWP